MQVYHGSWMDHELLISRIRPEVKVIVSEANDDDSVRDHDPRGSLATFNFVPSRSAPSFVLISSSFTIAPSLATGNRSNLVAQCCYFEWSLRSRSSRPTSPFLPRFPLRIPSTQPRSPSQGRPPAGHLPSWISPAMPSSLPL